LTLAAFFMPLSAQQKGTPADSKAALAIYGEAAKEFAAPCPALIAAVKDARPNRSGERAVELLATCLEERTETMRVLLVRAQRAKWPEADRWAFATLELMHDEAVRQFEYVNILADDGKLLNVEQIADVTDWDKARSVRDAAMLAASDPESTVAMLRDLIFSEWHASCGAEIGRIVTAASRSAAEDRLELAHDCLVDRVNRADTALVGIRSLAADKTELIAQLAILTIVMEHDVKVLEEPLHDGETLSRQEQKELGEWRLRMEARIAYLQSAADALRK